MSGGPNPVDGAGRARYAARIVGRPEGFGEAGLPDLAVLAMRLWRRRAEQVWAAACGRLWPRRAPSQVALRCKWAALAQVVRRLRAGRAGSERRAGAPMGAACLQIW